MARDRISDILFVHVCMFYRSTHIYQITNTCKLSYEQNATSPEERTHAGEYEKWIRLKIRYCFNKNIPQFPQQKFKAGQKLMKFANEHSQTRFPKYQRTYQIRGKSVEIY